MSTGTSQVLAQRRTPCLARLDAARPWGPAFAVRVDGLVVGVRATEDAAEEVEASLRHRRAPAYDNQVPPTFSVEPARPSAFGLVYRDHAVAARRRDTTTLLADLDALVTASALHAHEAAPALRACAIVVRGASVVLLPPLWHQLLLLHQARLARDGLELLAPDVHAVALTEDHAPCLDGVPVRTWALRVDSAEPTCVSAARAVQLGFGHVANLGVRGPAATLRDLAVMARIAIGVLPVPREQLPTVAKSLACAAAAASGGIAGGQVGAGETAWGGS